MKKFLFVISFLFIFLSSFFGYEWGVNFINSTEFMGHGFDSLKLNQNDSLSIWSKIPLNKDNSTYIVGDASYRFKYENAGNNPSGIQHIVNLNMLKFTSEFRINDVNKVVLMAGRFPVVDSTTNVFSQVSDGLYLKYAGVFANISLYGGYTGLLNSKEVTILTPNKTKYVEASNDFYTLAPKYVPVSVMLNFPSFFANQQLNLQGWGFFDLNEDNYNRYYASVTLDGYLAKGFHYSLYSVFGTVNFENMMNSSALKLKYFISDFMALQGGVLYASGNQGSLSEFKAVSSKSVVFTYTNSECANLFKADFGPSFSILGRCLISAKGAYVADFTETSMNYRGTQWEANIIWNLFDDFQASVSMGQFYGKKLQDNKTSMSVNIYLAL